MKSGESSICEPATDPSMRQDLVRTLQKLCSVNRGLADACLEEAKTQQPGQDVSPVATVRFGNNRRIDVTLLPLLAPQNAVVAVLYAHGRCLRRRGHWAQELIVAPQLHVQRPIVLTRRVGIANLDPSVLLKCLHALMQA